MNNVKEMEYRQRNATNHEEKKEKANEKGRKERNQLKRYRGGYRKRDTVRNCW